MTTIKRRYGNTWRVIGTGSSSVPLAPIHIEAAPGLAGQALIAWQAPPDTGGSAITGYTVTYTRVSTGVAATSDVSAATRSLTLSGLTAGLYWATVHATNANGNSTESDIAQVEVVASGGGSLTMPTLANTGPRLSTTRTITASAALTELRTTGLLQRTIITGTFTLAGSDGVNWIIEDCEFQGGSLYGIRSYTTGAFTGTQEQRPIVRYCNIIGAGAFSSSSSSACIYGDDIKLDHCNLWGGVDGVKARNRIELRSCWVHDLDHPSGAHSDAVQIVSGTEIVFIGNRFDAYVGYSSDGSSTPTGETGSGMLQTGAVSGPITALWEDNWFAGGHYTIRGDADVRVAYTFRRNRWRRFGESVALGLTNLPPNRYGPTYGGVTTNSVWEDNVWDDTGAPIT